MNKFVIPFPAVRCLIHARLAPPCVLDFRAPPCPIPVWSYTLHISPAEWPYRRGSNGLSMWLWTSTPQDRSSTESQKPHGVNSCDRTGTSPAWGGRASPEHRAGYRCNIWPLRAHAGLSVEWNLTPFRDRLSAVGNCGGVYWTGRLSRGRHLDCDVAYYAGGGLLAG